MKAWGCACHGMPGALGQVPCASPALASTVLAFGTQEGTCVSTGGLL